ncbi:MAG: prolyl oligopeptidase family protein, partial [Paucimonas sp.]|nr:prolyl oligopeptidase family protein [Paucimonas sp.]
TTEPPRTHWFDKDFEAAQRIIDAAIPDHINELSGDPKVRILVRSYSSTEPGMYLLYDVAKKKLEPLFKAAKWIEPAKMSEKLIFDYQARDGLPIPSYLTLPKGKPEKALPLVVLVHGGPMARDSWHFDPTVQFLADLGYAVFQPQFRGSTGFGLKHFESGFKQWGLAMQDDVTDGVKSLISQGLVDPERICIMGASYGGYAALMGVIREPDMFRCAINLMGVTNLSYLYEHGRWYRSDYFKYAAGEHMGDPVKDRARFDATSPELLAGKIRVPVFLAYNGQDTRVPLIHGERMRDVLKAKGKVYEWMEFPDEEHGYAKEENRYKVYDAIERFLTKHNPAH